MRSFIKNIRYKETGAISTLVLFTILIFIVILMGVFLGITTMQKSQLKSDLRIQEIYGDDVSRIDEIYAEIVEKGVSISEIYDETGLVEDKLHIGDFVNYTAGTWEDGKITNIANTGVEANNSTELPSTAYQFGGFTEESSRDGNATPHNASYNYVQETTKEGIKQSVTGWRVFDIKEDGTIILISAGCPEDYYHPAGNNNAYISEYILTGNINENIKGQESTLGLGTTYKARDWSMYLNSNYKATSATVLTKEKIDEWYVKYMDLESADVYNDIFKNIYGTKYESLIDNYSYYWLATAADQTFLIDVNPEYQQVFTYYEALGLRVLISLSPETKLSINRSGTKTITSRDVEYTYNVWDLK